jgi:nucleoside-diphosphate-sugar epimerase
MRTNHLLDKASKEVQYFTCSCKQLKTIEGKRKKQIMQVLLTGGTGYIGSAVLTTLKSHGHDVLAIVRSEEAATAVTNAGARAAIGDLTNVSWLTSQLELVDGAIHLAALDAAGDDAVLAAVTAAFADTEKPYVHTGGVWVWGDSSDINEDSPRNAPAIVSWRIPREETLLASTVKASVIAPGVVYGHGKGIAAGVLGYGPRTEDGALILIGSGEQHWSTVHVEDIAELFVLALENAPGGETYIAASGDNPTVQAIAQAIVGPNGSVAAESADATRARLGDVFADALFLDQQASGQKARQQLGWTPNQPSILVELAA